MPTIPLIEQIPESEQMVLPEAKFEYYMSMVLRCTASAVFNYPYIFLNVVFPSIKNENNMHLDDSESSVFLSIVSSVFFYGAVLGCILIKFFAKYNP